MARKKTLSVKLTPFKGDHDFSISRNYIFLISHSVFPFALKVEQNKNKNVNKIEIKI
jgi:hypothetical protein